MLRVGQYWSNEEKKWTRVETSKFKELLGISADAVDWDADGDLDLVLGTNEGPILLRLNEGSAKKPAFATESLAVEAGGQAMKVPGGQAMPVVADWDGDGRWDLLSGSKTGAVYWFRNTGTRAKPAFDPARCIVKAAKDLTESQRSNWPGTRVAVAVADFDGDGDLDLLVGDYNSVPVKGSKKRRMHGWVWLFRRR